MQFTDYYKLLEIEHTSTLLEISTAYKKAAIKWHPDKNKHDTTKMMQLVNEAKIILVNPESKTLYDQEYLIYYKDSKKSKFSYAKEQYTDYNYDIKQSRLSELINNAKNQAIELVKTTYNLGYSSIKDTPKEAFLYLKKITLIGIIFITIIILGLLITM